MRRVPSVVLLVVACEPTNPDPRPADVVIRDVVLDTSVDVEGVNEAGGRTAPSVLVFSRTMGFRHDAIEAGVAALTALAADRHWQIDATEDAGRFTDTGLAPYDVVVFLNTTGDVLDPPSQAAFERFIRAGKGYVGIHAASDTEYDWPWYGGLVGAYLRAHPAVQPASVRVERPHAATYALPVPWVRTDEWYAFRTNPRGRVSVLLTLDEGSYDPGEASMGTDHPIAWFHVYDGGRAFYTALGHTRESYAEPLFLRHVAGGVEWAAGRD